MQLDWIDTFLDLLETKNFNRTAERLNITQSTVSARVQSLEKHVGAVLFERGRGGAHATPAGRRFIDYARSIKLSWTMARQDIGVLDKFDGLMRFASQVSLMDQVLLKWVDKLKVALPSTAIYLEADYSNQMVTDLMFGNLDIALLYMPRYIPDISYEEIFRERMVMVSSDSPHLSDQTPERYIRVSYSGTFDKQHSEFLPDLCRSRLAVGLGSMAVTLLRREGGSCYLPEALADDFVENEGFMRVEDAPDFEQRTYVATHVRRRHDHKVQKALRALKEVCDEQGLHPGLEADGSIAGPDTNTI
ncbi:LysR family transcriptional regulator [Coralliovum pocilloporae]|uniref:LysR family transcriptional regulator n=1 Tax=Coralliovum pocilloporae TaxID=3066369 RepID=UPI003307946B